MNKKQIDNFINKHSPISTICRYIPYNKTLKFEYTASATYLKKINGGIINLVRKTFMYQTDIYQKVCLLHEIGHLAKPNGYEYEAQLWAITYATSKKWIKITKILINELLRWDLDFKWNEAAGNYRRYIIASKKFKKRFKMYLTCI